jgi:hypothetical protein
MKISTALIVVASLAAGLIVATFEYRSRTNVVSLGFWFDNDVTFEVHDPARFGPAMTAAERSRIKGIARDEITVAFGPFRVQVTEAPNAFYRVRVRQVLTVGRKYAAAGQSHVFGPLGGDGAVGFLTLSAQAMAYAPEGATRAEIVDAIGRGIGRAAVHEFVHQILPKGPVHISTDRASYEFWSSDRPAQYYGDMRWSVARDALAQRLGR